MDSTKTTDAPMTSDGSNTTDVSRTTEVRRSTQDDKSTNDVDGRATETQPAKVDNSGRNEVDKDGHTMTPFDQGSSDGDMAITQNIRKMLVADGSLSINAQNLKVITNNGIVVLRGPVASQMESDVILAHVNKVIGITKVENQINVP